MINSVYNEGKVASDIEKRSYDNDLTLNLSKANILCIKGAEPGDTICRLKKGLLKDVIMSRNLSWSENCCKRTLSSWRSLYLLMKNTSKCTICNKTKLNAGYVRPVLTYASQPPRSGTLEKPTARKSKNYRKELLHG